MPRAAMASMTARSGARDAAAGDVDLAVHEPDDVFAVGDGRELDVVASAEP